VTSLTGKISRSHNCNLPSPVYIAKWGIAPINKGTLANTEEKTTRKSPLKAIEEYFSQENNSRKNQAKEHKLINDIAIALNTENCIEAYFDVMIIL